MTTHSITHSRARTRKHARLTASSSSSSCIAFTHIRLARSPLSASTSLLHLFIRAEAYTRSKGIDVVISHPASTRSVLPACPQYTVYELSPRSCTSVTLLDPALVSAHRTTARPSSFSCQSPPLCRKARRYAVGRDREISLLGHQSFRTDQRQAISAKLAQASF